MWSFTLKSEHGGGYVTPDVFFFALFCSPKPGVDRLNNTTLKYISLLSLLDTCPFAHI